MAKKVFTKCINIDKIIHYELNEYEHLINVICLVNNNIFIKIPRISSYRARTKIRINIPEQYSLRLYKHKYDKTYEHYYLYTKSLQAICMKNAQRSMDYYPIDSLTIVDPEEVMLYLL